MNDMCDCCHGTFNGSVYTSEIVKGFYCSLECRESEEKLYNHDLRKHGIKGDKGRD